MSNKIYTSLFEFIEETDKTHVEYYNQWKKVNIEVGKVFQMKGACIGEPAHIEIIAIVDDVAIGKQINGGSWYENKKTMFHATGNKVGWKYQENRYTYRLEELGEQL